MHFECVYYKMGFKKSIFFGVLNQPKMHRVQFGCVTIHRTWADFLTTSYYKPVLKLHPMHFDCVYNTMCLRNLFFRGIEPTKDASRAIWLCDNTPNLGRFLIPVVL